MKKILSIVMLISLALLVLGVAGCGSGGSPDALSKQQFIKKAKAICIKAETEQYNQGFAYFERHPGIEEEDAVVPAALPPIEKELTKLQELPAPQQSQDQLTELYEALEKAIADTKKDPGSALIAKNNPFNKPNKLAEAADLESCSANP